MAKRILILSFDALGGKDFEFMKTLPAFEEFFRDASICTNVRSVYPSVTYPCHVSVVTGKYPKNHGVVDNTLMNPSRLESPDWYWQDRYIKVDTIYDLAIDSGMKVGAFLWPVTGKSRIQYNFPEIFPNRFWDNQIFVSLRNGSPLFLLDLFRKYKHVLDGIRQPFLDEFVTECVVDTIHRKTPEMMLVHFTDLDTARHEYGVDSVEARDAILRLEKRFARIVSALKDANLYSETVISIFGDHFQLDYANKVMLNEKLADHGLLSFHDKKIIDWKVMAKSCGGSAYIYFHPSFNDWDGVTDFLEVLKGDPENGIERIFSNDEAVLAGADPNCAFMLEATDGHVFVDVIGEGYKGKLADHGYHPTSKNDYKTFFAMSGPGVKKGKRIEEMSLVDIAPTWSKLLKLELEDVDGIVLDILE